MQTPRSPRPEVPPERSLGVAVETLPLHGFGGFAARYFSERTKEEEE